MSKKITKTVSENSFTEFLMYSTPNGGVKVEIFLKDENIWLTQDKMGQLFGIDRTVVTKHLKNIYAEGELVREATSAKIAQVQKEGNREVTRNIEYYNLDTIISVGYRVNSAQATQFRIWATQVLKEYIIKGFAMNDERLKNPNTLFGKDYFEEQLARIRDIRSSERRFYQKITDIYAKCSADYDSNSPKTQQFFASVQNKLHWAITQKTVAEIIVNRADSEKQNMGLTSWKNAPAGDIRKTDVSIAKNYLDKEELDGLNRIVTMYLDYAEMQANKQKIMTMKDWASRLDAFLQFNEQEILKDSGKVTAEIAKQFAESEFEKYSIIQDRLFESDFDKEIKKQLGNANTK
jgi:hypothetical protein